MLIFFTILISILLIFLQNHLNYFKKRKVPYLKSIPLLGAFSDYFIKKKNFYECMSDIYNHPKLRTKSFFGIFIFHKPAIFLKDLNLIKQILMKDANYFPDRLLSTPKNDPLHNNIGTVKDPDWSRARKKLTPIFTSLKLKSAFCHIDEIAKLLVSKIKTKIDSNESEMDVKTLADHYIIDASANVLFGFNPKALEGKIDPLYVALNTFSTLTFKRGLELIACFLISPLFKIMRIKFFGSHFTSFILELMPKIFEEREESGKVRNDFVNILLKLKKDKELTDEEIAAQAAVFFVGANESTSATFSNLLYELAKNPKVQKKLRDEIQKYFQENQEITFEAVAQTTFFPFLDCVINETLRMHPFVPFIDRVCTKKDGYSLEPFSDFKIPPGMPLLIPLHALGYDETYFDDPWTFKPERFDGEIQQGASIPFGLGPRSCIGSRFAEIVLKTAIVKIFKDFRVEMCERTPKKLTIKHNAVIIQHNENKILKFVK